ncbi:MAG: hypothetical protein Q7J86_04395 [Bacteroidota bacterium]|nr:hypothetical protein [Bacteroidota bacterium]MDO9613748.1 hypothetical protein [Bacteroidota bacterium]
MIFDQGSLYHIYNQGNNRQKIFFKRDNYLFFLKKINQHIMPHADILAWCLMPNHFHLMVHVKQVFVPVTDGVTSATDGVTWSHPVSKLKEISFNHNIGILLRSYARAINKQEQRVGALFREETKAECVTPIEGITPSFYNTSSGALIHVSNSEMEYPQICFDYIHFNPVSARLVVRPEEWEFSSYRDYCGIRDGKLINRKIAKEFGIEF